MNTGKILFSALLVLFMINPAKAQVVTTGQSGAFMKQESGLVRIDIDNNVIYHASGVIESSDAPMPSHGYEVGTSWTATFIFDMDNAVTDFDPSAAIVSHDILSGHILFNNPSSAYSFENARIIVEDADYPDFFNNLPDDSLTFVIGPEDITSTINPVDSEGFAFNFSAIGRDDVIDNPGFDDQTLEILSVGEAAGGGTFLVDATVVLGVDIMEAGGFPGQPLTDLNGDGAFDYKDVAEYIERFGRTFKDNDFEKSVVAKSSDAITLDQIGNRDGFLDFGDINAYLNAIESASGK